MHSIRIRRSTCAPSGTRTPNPLISVGQFWVLLVIALIRFLTCANAVRVSPAGSRHFSCFPVQRRGVKRGLVTEMTIGLERPADGEGSCLAQVSRGAQHAGLQSVDRDPGARAKRALGVAVDNDRRPGDGLWRHRCGVSRLPLGASWAAGTAGPLGTWNALGTSDTLKASRPHRTRPPRLTEDLCRILGSGTQGGSDSSSRGNNERHSGQHQGKSIVHAVIIGCTVGDRERNVESRYRGVQGTGRTVTCVRYVPTLAPSP